MSDEHTTPAPITEETTGTFESAAPAEETPTVDASTTVDDTATAAASPQYGVGPFTIREVALAGVWVVALVVSFFSVWADSRVASAVVPFGSVWTSGIDWILTIGVPTVAVFLIVLRRFSPDGIRRVGSLAVDQFASVAFSVSAVVWLGILWSNIARAIQTGLWLSSWVVWVEFFLMVAGVFLTVLAPFIQPFDEDFRGRAEVAAHRNARPVRAVSPRPAPVRATPAESAPSPYAETAAYAPVVESESEPAAEQVSEQTPEPVATQAFWALAPVERNVVDENGLPLFTVGPTAWALVIEDRGDSFVVRHEDGRVGFLNDVSGITRG